MLSTLICFSKISKLVYIIPVLLSQVTKATVTSLNTSPYTNFPNSSQMSCFLQPGSNREAHSIC